MKRALAAIGWLSFAALVGLVAAVLALVVVVDRDSASRAFAAMALGCAAQGCACAGWRWPMRAFDRWLNGTEG